MAFRISEREMDGTFTFSYNLLSNTNFDVITRIIIICRFFSCSFSSVLILINVRTCGSVTLGGGGIDRTSLREEYLSLGWVGIVEEERG